MDSHVINSPVMETAYTRIMGHMDVVSIVSDYFNIYFPIALLALTFSTYFSVGARILSGERVATDNTFFRFYSLANTMHACPVLGFQQFLDQDSELTQELVEEGKEHIKRERRRIQRMKESASRRREFAERFVWRKSCFGARIDRTCKARAYRFGREESGRAGGEEDNAGVPTSTNPRFLRKSDIVKPRNPQQQQEVSSPERSLLPGSSGLYGMESGGGGFTGSPSSRGEIIDLSVPSTRTTPPRNIFDDL